jgi:hypothetical protein
MSGVKFVRIVPLLVLLAGPAAAQCLTSANLEEGILFDRQGAGTGSAIAAGDGVVQVNYDAAREGYTDLRNMAQGVYETSILTVAAPPDVIGAWSERTETRRHADRFPAPESGRTWETTITLEWDTSDFSGIPKAGRSRVTAVYAFLEPMDVTVSGCNYQVIPVELRVSGQALDYTTRYAYFPTLGVAIETRVTDHLTGTQTTTGIIGMRAVQ